MAALSLNFLSRSLQRLSLRQMSTLPQAALGSFNSTRLGLSPGAASVVQKNGKPLSKREYIICPTNSLTCVILDVSISNPISCPTYHNTQIDLLLPNPLIEYTDKDAPSLYDFPSKEAVDKLRRQRSRMNQHKKRRYRHDNLVLIREHKFRQREKRAKKDWAVIDKFRNYSANFDAEEKVMRDLETARRGGFYVECFGPNREDRSTGDKSTDKSLDIL